MCFEFFWGYFMNNIETSEKEFYQYIKDNLLSCRIISKEVNNADFHHNSPYKRIPSIIRYGILSVDDLIKYGFSNIVLDANNDNYYYYSIDHVNGVKGVSLSKVGLNDLYKNEEEYNPFNCQVPDILVSNEVKASRTTFCYGNEFVTSESIDPKFLKAVDVRILNFLSENTKDTDVVEAINMFNTIIDIANTLNKYRQDMILREMSKENITLDFEKVSSLSKIRI